MRTMCAGPAPKPQRTRTSTSIPSSIVLLRARRGSVCGWLQTFFGPSEAELHDCAHMTVAIDSEFVALTAEETALQAERCVCMSSRARACMCARARARVRRGQCCSGVQSDGSSTVVKPSRLTLGR